jgi:integrase
LRVGELAGLQVTDLELDARELHFYRPKVDKLQTHKLTPDTLRAARAYVDAGDVPAMGPLLRASHKGGGLAGAGMSERAITGHVRALGSAVGLADLSAHDLRHYWARRAARNGTPLDRLQDAGGWASSAMPLRYVEVAKIANQGVKLEA